MDTFCPQLGKSNIHAFFKVKYNIFCDRALNFDIQYAVAFVTPLHMHTEKKCSNEIKQIILFL